MEEKVKILKSLADNNRFKIIEFLLECDFCVGALSKRLNLTEAAVSQHLKVLREAGVVWGEKRGYYTHYTVNKDVLKTISDELLKLHEIDRKNNRCRRICQANRKKTISQ